MASSSTQQCRARGPRWARTFAVLSLLATHPVAATDFGLVAHRLRLASSTRRQSLVWVVRAPVTMPATDPRSVGAILELSNPLSGERATRVFPAAGWNRNATGTVYRFRDRAVGAAMLRERTLRIATPATLISLDEPAQGALAVVLEIGTDRWCSTCSAPLADGPGRFLARRCSVGPCGGVPPTTTTTTVPAASSCRLVLPSPESCATDIDCPAGYGCDAGACTAGPCQSRTDCPADGECVFAAEGEAGSCVCRGCGVQACPVGCHAGFFFSGCLCTSIRDCPPEDDVCFRGVCN